MGENDYDTTVMAAHWDQRYAERDQIWSGRPNVALIAEITGVAPGRALDLGCGEGADAIWLGQQGWQVTGVDVSAVALERAERHAVESGVADQVTFEKHDLALSLPAGPFDLVQAQFLHSTAWIPRDDIIRRAAALVVPGGLLLVVGHVGWPSFVTEEDHRAPSRHGVPDPGRGHRRPRPPRRLGRAGRRRTPRPTSPRPTGRRPSGRTGSYWPAGWTEARSWSAIVRRAQSAP